MADPLLINLAPAPAPACDHCLEELYKAMSQDPKGTGDAGIWRPHENPYLRWLVEDWSARLSRAIQAMQDDFARMLTGQPLGDLRKAAYPGMVWSPEAFERVRLVLETLPQEQWTIDDYMLAADFIIMRHLPEGVIQTEADYLTVRAALMGKIQASMAAAADRRRQFTADQAEALANLLPTSFRKVPIGAFTPVEMKILEIARSHCAEEITAVTEAQRSRMRQFVIEHVQAMLLGQKDAGTNDWLRSRLFDTFGTLNRDFRRIAVTEAGEAHSMGFVAAQAVGTKVRRIEAYEGACDWCRSINGKVFRVVAPDDPERDGETDIWVGKTNVGRSASPMKRQGEQLVLRPPEERWWVAAGTQHPHCRGTWQPVGAGTKEGGPLPAGVDPKFAAWLEGRIKAAGLLPKPNDPL